MESNSANNQVINTPSPVQPVVQPSPTHSKKPFIIIGILVAILLLATGAGAYYLGMQNKNTKNETAIITTPSPVKTLPTPTPDSIGGWKTYTNTKYSFSINHPTNFNTNCKIDSYDCSFDTFVGPGRGPTSFIWLSVVPEESRKRTYTVYNQEGIDTLLSLAPGASKATSNQGSDIEDSFTYTRLPDTSVGGITGKVFENTKPWEFPANTIERRVYVSHNDYLYIIGAYTHSEDISLDMFDQILSTFKFTNPTANTTNWNTYENTTIGFTVNHPQNWEVVEKSEPQNSLRVTIKGPEGELGVLWTTGLGGGCEQQYQTPLKLADIEKSVCTSQSDPSKITEWGWYEPSYNGNGRVFNAKISSSSVENRKLLTDMLSTLKVTRN